MIPIIFSAITVALALVGLIYKISAFATKQEAANARHDQRLNALYSYVARVPLLEFRLGHVEKYLDLSVPDMPPTLNGSGSNTDE